MEDKQIIVDDLIFKTEFVTSDFEFFFKNNEYLSPYLIESIQKALNQKNPRALNLGLEAIFIHGNIDSKYSEIFASILLNNEYWNKTHEFVCEMLEGIKDPSTVEVLFKTVRSHPPSDIHSIPLKAMWALRSIGTNEAKEKLIILSSDTNEIIKKIAKDQLKYFVS